MTWAGKRAHWETNERQKETKSVLHIINVVFKSAVWIKYLYFSNCIAAGKGVYS